MVAASVVNFDARCASRFGGDYHITRNGSRRNLVSGTLRPWVPLSVKRDNVDYALAAAGHLPPSARSDDDPRAFRKSDQGAGISQGQHLFRKSQRLSREFLIHSRLRERDSILCLPT